MQGVNKQPGSLAILVLHGHINGCLTTTVSHLQPNKCNISVTSTQQQEDSARALLYGLGCHSITPPFSEI